jgi:hypothetical protein
MESPLFGGDFVKNLRLLSENNEEREGLGFTKGRLNTIGSHSLTQVRTSRFVFCFQIKNTNRTEKSNMT